MPTFSRSLVVNAPQSEVFAILDDVRRTPDWLARCTGIHYKDGKRTGEMDGQMTVHDPTSTSPCSTPTR